MLVQSGLKLPPPDHLTDSGLYDKLWELIRTLLELRISIDNTDHLSDRELYTVLCNETLQSDFAAGTGCILHIDMTESADYEEGLQTYLKYYASEKELRRYARMFPDLTIPAHCEPPARRDHLIP